MWTFLLLMITALMTDAMNLDPASEQTVIFKKNTKYPIGIITTSSGAPVEKNDTLSTLNTNLNLNEYFTNSMGRLVSERIPVRVVHPKGAGAFGYLETTRDMSNYTKAEFLCGVGKVTPVAARFSTSFAERGASDLGRDNRGMALKMYTREGNFDIVGLNTPIFRLRDPTYFPPSVHAFRENPATGFKDKNMLWDFILTRPESIYVFMMEFGDKGIPDGYRNTHCHSVHTYSLYNAAGKITLCRFHFLPSGGAKYLNSTEAARLGAIDPDYNARTLYNDIHRGDYPTWDMYMQLMPEEKLKKTTIDPYDVTKVIPEKLFPWIKMGKLVFNINPQNHFAEVEQMAFSPANLVCGILSSPDKIFEARRVAYVDAQRYRLGSNFHKIPVNYPYRSKYITYNRDGTAPVGDNGRDAPNYYPNSFNGPIPYIDKNRPPVPTIQEAEANNFDQARDYYTNQLDGDQRMQLAQNIVVSLCDASNFLQDRAVEIFSKIHPDFAARVAKELKIKKCKNCVK